MDWLRRLEREAIALRLDDFDLHYLPAVRPPVPPEYVVPGLVAVTFRLRKRSNGGHVYATLVDLAAAVRVGGRLGLDAAESLAMVDSHERIHVALQLAGVSEEAEERHSSLVDAVWLSLRHPRAAERVRAGDFGLVTRVEDGFWEALVEAEPFPPPPGAGKPGAKDP